MEKSRSLFLVSMSATWGCRPITLGGNRRQAGPIDRQTHTHKSLQEVEHIGQREVRGKQLWEG